jgi:hypothetical protein
MSEQRWVFRIEAKSVVGTETKSSAGTCFLLSEKISKEYNEKFRFFITCKHVIRDEKSGQFFEQIIIRTYSNSSGQREIIPLDLANHIIVRKSADVALILIPKIEMEGCIGLDIDENSPAITNESVDIWGFPIPCKGLKAYYISGVLASTPDNVDINGKKLEEYVINGDINNGISGGPLCFKSKVIGIVNSKASKLAQDFKEKRQLHKNSGDIMTLENVSLGDIIDDLYKNILEHVQLGMGAAIPIKEIVPLLVKVRNK